VLVYINLRNNGNETEKGKGKENKHFYADQISNIFVAGYKIHKLPQYKRKPSPSAAMTFIHVILCLTS